MDRHNLTLLITPVQTRHLHHKILSHLLSTTMANANSVTQFNASLRPFPELSQLPLSTHTTFINLSLRHWNQLIQRTGAPLERFPDVLLPIYSQMLTVPPATILMLWQALSKYIANLATQTPEVILQVDNLIRMHSVDGKGQSILSKYHHLSWSCQVGMSLGRPFQTVQMRHAPDMANPWLTMLIIPPASSHCIARLFLWFQDPSTAVVSISFFQVGPRTHRVPKVALHATIQTTSSRRPPTVTLTGYTTPTSQFPSTSMSRRQHLLTWNYVTGFDLCSFSSEFLSPPDLNVSHLLPTGMPPLLLPKYTTRRWPRSTFI